MPIYDQGYRRYEARGPLHRIRFWPITREALRLILAKRAFLGLIAVSFLPFIVRVIQIYIVTRFPEAGRVLPIDGRLFGDFLNQQIGFTILLSIFGASGLVANDLRTGAILVYLSRPLTQRDYIAGKLLVPLTLSLAVTFVPGLVLYLVGLALAPEQYLKWDLWWIAPAVVAHAVAVSVVVSLVILAVSSLSSSARVAGLGFVGLVFGLEMIRLILQNGFNRREAVLLSLQADLQALGVALFGVVNRQLDIFWGWPLLVLGVVSLGCLAILRSRVRAVEIVT
jgi:ABC-type transport system involved in multi-copper enzyme maturation permease subunit